MLDTKPKVLVTTNLPPLRQALKEILVAVEVDTQFVSDRPCDLDSAIDGATAVVCTPEVDWKNIILRCGEDVPVILLLQCNEPKLWAEALTFGAFDAVTLDAQQAPFLGSVSKAIERKSRKQQVQEAFLQNPLHFS